jgi:hypothetical protein
MTPADLFRDVKVLGRCEKLNPHTAGALYGTFWEYRNGARLVCASITEENNRWEALVSLHFADSEESEWLPDQSVSFLKGLLRDDVEWERVAGQTFRAYFSREVTDGSQRDT